MAYIGRSVDVGMFEKQVITADSSTTTFTLTFAVGSANSLLVVYGGVVQEPAVAYSVSGGGQQIVFSEAPVTGTTTYIIYLGKQLTTPRAAGQETTKQTFAGDGSTVTFTLTDPPVVPAGIMVFVDGILQREGSGNNYVSSGSTITFTSAPDSSAEIDVYTLVKEKVSIDTVADGSITRAKLAQSAPYWDGAGNVGINVAAPAGVLDMQKDQDAQTLVYLRNASTGTSARTRMIFSGDASAGNLSIGMYNSTNSSAPNQAWVWASGASSPLILGTVGTERVRITTSGDVGIGTSSPSQKLDVSGNINVSGTGTSNFTSTATSPVQINGTSIPTLTINNSTASVETQVRSTTTEGLIRTATNHPLLFGTNAAERMRITSTGDLKFGTASATASASVQAEFKRAGNSYTLQLTNDESGNGPGNNMRLVQGFNSYIQASNGFYLDPTGVLGVTKGITFPASQVASGDANTLDDYEEGTWTPNQGSGLTIGGTFTSSGIYTKIGNLVTVNFRVGGSASVACSSTGEITSNLPFAIANTPGNAMGSCMNSSNAVSGAYGYTTTITNSTTALSTAGAIFVTITYQV
jgi:hypothetical protein